MKHFTRKEFNCPCCGANLMEPAFLEMLDKARGIAGIPFKINSGYRCAPHNKNEGGSPTSSHVDGWAADINCIGSRHRFIMVDALREAGFERIGIRKDFIHVDCDPQKDERTLWIY